MLPVLIAVAVVVTVAVLLLAWRRLRPTRTLRAAPEVEVDTDLPAGRRRTDRVNGTSIADDPRDPPAAIHMAVSGTHPWAPARVFLAELKAEGFETTVELPDLVVMRDADRLPVTVREPAGPPGQLVITSTPTQLPLALEVLVRSLLASDFTLDATDGRDVALTDDHGAAVNLRITQLSQV